MHGLEWLLLFTMSRTLLLLQFSLSTQDAAHELIHEGKHLCPLCKYAQHTIWYTINEHGPVKSNQCKMKGLLGAVQHIRDRTGWVAQRQKRDSVDARPYRTCIARMGAEANVVDVTAYNR